MNKYYFSQAVRILRQTFKVGVRDVSEEVERHPDFLNYVKCGWVSEPTKQQLQTETKVNPKSEKQRNAALYEKLTKNASPVEPPDATPPLRKDEEKATQKTKTPKEK